MTLTRRTVLGTLGAVGAAAAVPIQAHAGTPVLRRAADASADARHRRDVPGGDHGRRPADRRRDAVDPGAARRLRGRRRAGRRRLQEPRPEQSGDRRDGDRREAVGRLRPLPGGRARAGSGVLLPVPRQGHRLTGRPVPDPAPGGLERAGPDRLLHLPGLHRGVLRHPPAPRRRRISTWSSASATTCTRRPCPASAGST